MPDTYIPIAELHQAVYERLHDEITLNGAVVQVFDEIVPEANPPFVEIGEQNHRGPAHKGGGWEATIEVNAWSTYAGTKEAAALANRIVERMAETDYDLGDGRVALTLGFDPVRVSPAKRNGIPGYLGVVRQRLKIST